MRCQSRLSIWSGWKRSCPGTRVGFERSGAQIDALEAEASAHEMILRLGRDSNLRRALDELHDQPDLAERIAEDQRSSLREAGCGVPDGAIVTVRTDPDQSAVEARFDDPLVNYGVGWSRTVGFYVIQGQGFVPEPESTAVPNREGG